MTQRPAIVDSFPGIQNTLRGTAGGHPLCNESFQAGVEPWIHAKAMHQASTETTDSGDKLEAEKKQFLQRGQHCAITNQVGSDPSPKATPSIDSTKTNIGEDIEQHDQGGPYFALGHKASGPKTEEAEYPVLEQSNLIEPQSISISANIPQKRPVRVAFGPPEPAAGSPRPKMFPPPENRFGGDPEAEPEMLLQPENRPISHEELVVNVKQIYAGLAVVEAKCIDIDERQWIAAQEKDPSLRIQLQDGQWQSLFALHKRLLHEHMDFFLASQHPNASPALTRLAAKYSMPTRLWRHGIHTFLEVLRHRLPESSEHILAFIHFAYSTIALLYEMVSSFEDTWIECLGDLGRYRMAIEVDEPKDREVWSNITSNDRERWSDIARFWYKKLVDKSPSVGRLYHHLAILARPDSLEQLSLYARSLTCVTPFKGARGSIMTLFDPVLQRRKTRRASSLEMTFIRAHAILFTSKRPGLDDNFDATVNELVRDGLFDKYIGKAASKFREFGTFAAISNIAALFEYGTPKYDVKARLLLAYEKAQTMKDAAANSGPRNPNQPEDAFITGEDTDLDSDTLMSSDSEISSVFIARPSMLASVTLGIALNRETDKNTHPLVYVYLVFIRSLITAQEYWKSFDKDTAWRTIERDIPWYAICLFLNTIAGECRSSKIFEEEFPQPSDDKGNKEKARLLPEDFALRGQIYSQWCFPYTCFTEILVDDDKLQPPSLAQIRVERILWLGHRIAFAKRWIRFDVETKSFMTTNYVMNEFNVQAKAAPVSVDLDTIMTDAGITVGTPRTPSMASSHSHHGR